MTEETINLSRPLRVVSVVLALLVLAGIGWFWWSWPSDHADAPSEYAWLITGVVLLFVVFPLVYAAFEGSRWRYVANLVLVVVAAAGSWAAYDWNHRESELAEALGPACRGDGVERAASAEGPGPFKIVVLNGNGDDDIGWTFEDAEWQTTKVGEAALVACVKHDDELIETCEYVGGGFSNRYVDAVDVRVVVAGTGQLVGSFELQGEEPRECVTLGDEDEEIHGKVQFEDFAERLEAYAAGTTPETTTP